MKDSIKMGLRSLVYRHAQYRSLFLVCVFGVGISLFCVFLVNGMIDSLRRKSEIYYGGDFQFLGGYDGNQHQKDENLRILREEVFPKGTVISERYKLDEYTMFYFEGIEVPLRIIKGIDFTQEQALFAKFNYQEGDATEIAGTNGALISSAMAATLNVHVGDSVTFLLRNRQGAIDTYDVVIKGIYIDSSFYGIYTSYMDIDFLRNASKYPQSWCNQIAIRLPDGTPTKKQTLAYQKKLESLFSMAPLLEDKYDFDDYEKVFYKELSQKYNQDFSKSKKDPPDILYALITLDANLEQVKILIDAMRLVTGFVIAMLVLIIVVGVASTFRVIVMKRINEIGIYKAIGMKRSKITLMVLTEILILVVAGCVLAMGFSGVLVLVARHVNLSFIPAFDLFLTKGLLTPVMSFSHFVLISVIVCVTTLIAVLFAIQKSVSITPCEALAVTE